MPRTARTTPPVATPKGVKVADLPANVVAGLKEAHDPSKGLKGADIARVLLTTGHLVPKGNPGLVLRTYMRSHGAYVGKGASYGATVAEASRIAAGFITNTAPPKGGSFHRGTWVPTVKDDAKANA